MTTITKSQLRQMIKEAVQEQLRTKRKTPEQMRVMLKTHLGFPLNEPGTNYVLYILKALYRNGKTEARDLQPRPEMNTPRELFERMQAAGIIVIGNQPYLNYKLTSRGKQLVRDLGI